MNAEHTGIDPEGIYEAVEGFTDFRLGVTVREGSRHVGAEPVVMKHPKWFRLAPEDYTRRLLARMDAGAGVRTEAEEPRPLPELPAPRGPGRPEWTRELFARRYQEAFAATPEPRTVSHIAERFRCLDGTIGIEPGSLRRLIRRKWK